MPKTARMEKAANAIRPTVWRPTVRVSPSLSAPSSRRVDAHSRLTSDGTESSQRTQTPQHSVRSTIDTFRTADTDGGVGLHESHGSMQEIDTAHVGAVAEPQEGWGQAYGHCSFVSALRPETSSRQLSATVGHATRRRGEGGPECFDGAGAGGGASARDGLVDDGYAHDHRIQSMSRIGNGSSAQAKLMREWEEGREREGERKRESARLQARREAREGVPVPVIHEVDSEAERDHLDDELGEEDDVEGTARGGMQVT
eukprot:1767929-Rhodomonas_salina.1